MVHIIRKDLRWSVSTHTSQTSVYTWIIFGYRKMPGFDLICLGGGWNFTFSTSALGYQICSSGNYTLHSKDLIRDSQCIVFKTLSEIYEVSLFQWHICIRPDFLYTFQPNKKYCNWFHTETDTRTQLSSFWPDIKDSCKNVKMLFFSLNL